MNTTENDRTRWLALYVLCAGMLMIVLDATIVNVALPSIQGSLHFSQANLAWVVNAYMIPFGGAGLSWWWDYLDDQDLYGMFRPLAQFAAGEDRRGRGLKMSQGALAREGAPTDDLVADVLGNDCSAYFWIYERRLLRAEADPIFTPEPRGDLVLALNGFKDGDYRVEFWDTRKGCRVHETTVRVRDGGLPIPVPRFTGDIAGKVKPAVEKGAIMVAAAPR